jgi:tetratricopeptide (TPR) repeat protein
MRHRCTVLALLLLLFLSRGAFAQAPDPAQAEGLRLLEEGRTTLEEKPLAGARDYFTGLTQKDGNNAVYFYQLAGADSYLVESSEIRRDRKSAERALDAAIAAVQRALSLNDKSADAHSLLADLYGRKISFGGFFAGMRYGSKVDAENQRAVALDARNARVYSSLGRQYLHAPKMFGGNMDKAIDNFRKASQLDPSSDEIFVWLAIAYRKKGDTANADQALQQALRLNPRSVFAKNTAAGR